MFLLGGRALNMEWRRLVVLTVIKLRMPSKIIQESVYEVITSIRERKTIQTAS